MQQVFRNHIETHFAEMLTEPFLLACSGGIDSMVLWDLCAHLNLDFEVAHCNFQLRGSESEEDARFVREYANQNRKEIHVKSFNTNQYCSKNKVSVQEAARSLRYQWFKALLGTRGLRFVVTAHHLDDQLETFLINLSRGTGLEGLGGIPDRTPGIRRPLLAFTREEIESHATSRGLTWREDSSNREDKYLRNRLRRTAIPALKQVDERFELNFRKSLEYLRGSRALVRNHIARVKADLFSIQGEAIKIPVAKLLQLSPLQAYLHELFREYGFTDWEALQRLLTGHSGKEIHSATHRLLRDRELLLLKPREEPEAGTYTLELESTDQQTPSGLFISSVPEISGFASNVLYVDKETLNEGLQLRKWRKGDYFYPLGMQGRQKVSKYFKDHKFSRFDKESQWLLCSGEDIVWIVGHRADDRFKVREGTKHILRIEWKDSVST